MKKTLIMAVAMLACTGIMQAQENRENAGPDLTGETTTAGPDLTGESADVPMPAEQRKNAVDKDGKATWYINMDYAGFEFELPAGIVVNKGSSLVAKYPDNSFGLSMVNESGHGSNQKIAFEICRRMATELKIPDMRVEKVNFGKCGGAKASGMLDGSIVTILVLPYDGDQVTTVLMCSPQRGEWADHFVRTLKR